MALLAGSFALFRECMVLLLFATLAAYCFAEERAVYLVLVEGEAVAFRHGFEEGTSWLNPNSESSKAHANDLVNSHDQLLRSTLDAGCYSKLYSFKHIVNGFAVHTTPSQAEKLKHVSVVKVVERDRGIKLMTTYTPKFLKIPKAVWMEKEGGGEMRSTDGGEGVVIGFVDTGINPVHPSFAFDPTSHHRGGGGRRFFTGACETGPRFPPTSCNGKIVSARFFAAGAQAMAPLNSSVDFLSPFDAVGHGSHVASIAVGNYGTPVVVDCFLYGRASGMAPRARIAVYKAIYPSVGALADVVAAIDQATMDGVDILNLSVGPDGPPKDTITFLGVFEIVMLFARRAGVLVVQATGNHGPDPSTVVAFSPWAVGVAASTTDRTYTAALLLGNRLIVAGVGLSGRTYGNSSCQYKLVLAKDAIKANWTSPKSPEYMEECQYPEALEPAIVHDSVVICTFSAGFSKGTSTLTAIINTAKLLGFMGFVLVANPTYGDFVVEPIPFSVPAIMIPTVASAKIIVQYYNQHTYRGAKGFATRFAGRAAIGEGRVAAFKGAAPIVSRFSSRGPDIIDSAGNPADVLKPDILAPGHQIWAAWSPLSVLDPILNGYNFALVSGTSMATPHVAGIAALIKQHNPSWTPSLIASAISTTAIKHDKHGQPILAQGSDISSLNRASPFDFGAGLLDPARADNPGLVFPLGFQDYISFLCSLPENDPTMIRNATEESCSKPLSNPSDLNLPSVTISKLTGFRLVRRNVMNVGNKPETYLFSVLLPEGVIVGMYPPWFTIGPRETQDLEIHFNVTQATDEFSFGEIVLTGSLDHIVRMPLSVLPVSMSHK
ncbi:subtilisin-like protease SBT2.4 isoform X2 [Malania oleifera]|uniref:subtilisin-like protease SBT2.4 isoform X2 n=1 Tax=Malania oleifera TaxID=397392 RepID=UPI0025ADC812|nr:subtilisin-like protease SBT2.4 isoform X2 [Malania oleifera]